MLAGWTRRATEVLRRRQVDRDLTEEMAHHVAEAEARYEAAGLTPAEARRQAVIALGHTGTAREAVRDARTGAQAERLVREVRQAWRLLWRAPAATVLSIATMAAGIGASTVCFALIDAVVLAPLPYPEPSRLVRIVDVNPGAGVDRAGVTTGNLFDWRQRTSAFSGIAGHYAMGRTLGFTDGADVVVAAQVTADFFAVAGVAPALGRTFTTEEYDAASFSSAAMPTGTNPAVLLSDGLWRRRFGADPAVVGATVQLERRPFRIVGVMPPAFALPDAGVQLWMPWQLTAENPRDQHYLGATARLAGGVSLADAERDLQRAARALAEAYPATNAGWTVRVLPLHDEVVGAAGRALWLLFGAVAVLLAAACANVALLTILRGLDRAGETAVRLALGATPGRLVREFLIESLLLAIVGGGLGVALAQLAMQVLPAVVPDLPRAGEVALDARVLAFACLATALAALVSGCPPAWRRAHASAPAGALTASRRVTGPGRHRLRDALVTAQVALAVVLVLASGLLMRTVQALGAVDSGFDPRGVLVAPIFLDTQAYASGERVRTYYRTLFERLRALPGVVAVAGATTVPTSPLGPDFERPVWPAGTSPTAGERTPAAVRIVTADYPAALGLQIVSGRAIDARDGPDGPRVLMVSASLAERLWPGEPAVGRQLVVDYSTAGTYPYEVVGVVGDVRFRGPRSTPAAEIYLAHAQRPYLVLNVVVKTAGDPGDLAPAVRAAITALDPQKPAHGVERLVVLLGATYARDRLVMTGLMVFAGAATLLALIAVSGVLAQHVRERTREIGVRLAVGAMPREVVGWVTRTGVALLARGLAAGLAAAWLATRALDGWLFGVTPTDAVTLTAVLAVMTLVGVASAVVPSWRATRVDPVVVLRHE